MKKYLILIFVFPILFSNSCKKDDSDGMPTDAEYYRPLWEVFTIFDDLEEDLMRYSREGNDNLTAFAKAVADLEDDAYVTETQLLDSSYAYIDTKSGLQVVYALIPCDAEGNPLTRGAGNGSGAGGDFGLVLGKASNEIENKKILLYNAHFHTKYSADQVLEAAKKEHEIEVTTLSNEKCTYDVLNTFQDYGLVVLNTHGLPNGFQLGTELPVEDKKKAESLEEFAENINLSDQDKQVTDLIMTDLTMNIIHNKKYIPDVPIYQNTMFDADEHGTFVSSKTISQLNLSGTIVFGNMCYSAFSNTTQFELTDIPILEAFKQAGTRTYYGYQATNGMSRPVNSDMAEKFEEQLYRGFFEEGDSTGSAHLGPGQQEQYDSTYERHGFNDKFLELFGQLYLRQFQAKDYCYDCGCADSIQDSRDMQWYKTVCIGEQTWMAENLNYDKAGICYDNNSANCKKYGRLYSLNDVTGGQIGTKEQPVQGICPDNWHVPTVEECEELIALCGGKEEAYKKLLATDEWSSSTTDAYGFAFRPGGYNAEGNGNEAHYSIGDVGWIWTASEKNTWHQAFGANASSETVRISDFSYPDPIYRFSCRCIKDE